MDQTSPEIEIWEHQSKDCQTSYSEDEVNFYDTMMELDYSGQEEIIYTLAYLANTSKYTMYFRQYMYQPDKEEFNKYIVK